MLLCFTQTLPAIYIHTFINYAVMRDFVCINQIPKHTLSFKMCLVFYFYVCSQKVVLQSPDKTNILDSFSARSPVVVPASQDCIHGVWYYLL